MSAQLLAGPVTHLLSPKSEHQLVHWVNSALATDTSKLDAYLVNIKRCGQGMQVFYLFFGVNIHRFSGQCVACVVFAKSECFTSKWKHIIMNNANSCLATIDAARAAHPERQPSIPGLRPLRWWIKVKEKFYQN